ncbi:hypothetical protein AAL_04771 [Moelleriella libera RCEF 2490]|uniref:Cyclase n=1 Tax=Moelleriella libera RCEF 2490 TaxID=1081109 RepID=A0A166PB06_9HYPO|nr:hypothetical protein AAL_04771 [Moelleriella libera RCEF 2490]
MASRPPFSQLPLRRDGPPGNAWGLYGGADQLGTLNLLTPAVVAAAAAGEIRDGTRVSTDWSLTSMTPPWFGRRAAEHTIQHKAPRIVNDDEIVLNTQSSSQWDGLRHYGYQKEGLFYNAVTQADIMDSDVNGIQGIFRPTWVNWEPKAWAEAGGIVGRGVLIDYASWADSQNIPVEPFETESITTATLDAIASSQGTTFHSGDILFIRSGWTRAYNGLDAAQRAAAAKVMPPRAIGLESSKVTLKWLWEREFAAVAGDHPSMEAWPCQNPGAQIHQWLLAGWGMPIGELFDLEELSRACARRQRWSFFFSSVPLKVPGGVASPPNGVAIF